MKIIISRALQTICATGLVLLAAAVPPTHLSAVPGEANAKITKLESMLEARAVLTCPSQCGYCGTEHDNWDHKDATNQGENHDCATSPNGCLDHLCTPAFGGDDDAEVLARDEDLVNLDAMESLLTTADARSLAALTENHTNLTINVERRAIQVVGCGDKVVLSVNLSQHQLEELAKLM